ncbi:hypothetical protein [Thalassospira sp.]|uniref:hypothetical protein n=1 Tax=Thalassospira sp. TaxID=1912094 RepID=UPI0027367F91|nr:hypothetical protein [Thalassospira sp.]MDP2696810.1 hypothetical protein [Thalassospira sp.]
MKKIKTGIATILLTTGLFIGAHIPDARATSADLQALEAAIREARAMGLDPAQIETMQGMLDALRADSANQGADQYASDPLMEPNYFDVASARSYSDCGQYGDMQAYTFCMAAIDGYLTYTRVFAQQGSSPDANRVYDAHAETVRNLVNYVDNFMTAPRRY